MRLKSIVTTNFGKLANEKLDFGKGLTVVKGPNEAGKSFSIEAVTQGLYGDATSGAVHIHGHCRKWGSEGAFSLELEIESKGKKYKVIRDFENKKNILVKPDRTEIKDKESVRRQISELVGLPSQLAFEATACIPQDEVEKIGSAVSTLREIIEGRLAGSGSDTDNIVKKINKTKEEICSKSGKKGELVIKENEIKEFEYELEIKQERFRELTNNKKELEYVNQKLQSKTQRLQDKENAFKGNQEFMTVKSRVEKADKEFESTLENLNKYKKAMDGIKNATKELEPLGSKLETLASMIKKGKDYQEAEAKCKELKDKAKDLKKKISDIKMLDEVIQKKQKEIESYKKVDQTILQNARSIPGEIRGLSLSLAEQLFGIKVDLESDIEFSIIADGRKIKGSEAEMHAEAIVKFPGIASVQIKNLTGKEKPIAEEIKRKEDVLKRLLKRYEVNKVEELEALYEKRIKAIDDKENMEMRKETMLGDEKLSELKEDLKKLVKELEKENQIKEKLESHAITASEFERKKVNKQKLEARIMELSDIITRNKGIQEALGDDEDALEKLKREATKELAKAEAHLEEKKIFKCTPEAFAKLERETETLQEEVKELNEKQIKLSVRIEQETVGIEDIAVLEERLSGLERKKERLSHKYELLRIINDNITWARESSITQFSESIGAKMSKVLSKITNGKYNKVKVDENLGVSIYSKEKGDYINIDAKIDQLSSGTVDQIYLAARLAILGLIATEERPPIIMDDTFVSFDDMGRKERAFKVLESIAKDYQILYFTCHDCPEGLKVVELS